MSPRFTATAIHKSYPGVHALKGVNLHLYSGEVLAVLGENGAGKSTLMKILAGLQRPDSGIITLEGKNLNFHSVLDAKNHGIALIHQELQLADNLDAAANVFLGNEPSRRGFLLRSSMRHEAEDLLEKLGFGLPSHTPVKALSPGKRQIIEIARALATKARILILDEPTASLSQQETEKLFQIISQLRSDGVSLIYISHRLKEIQQIADRVTVLRDGENSGELTRDAISHEAMVKLMIGNNTRPNREAISPTQVNDAETIFAVHELCTLAYPSCPVSFSLARGEIIGIAGLVGAGRTELLRAIAGVDPFMAGTMNLLGKNFQPSSPAEAIAAGIVLAPEDRKHHGLLLESSVQGNLSLPSLSKLSRFGIFRSPTSEKNLAARQIAAMHIKCADPTQNASQLSGGNQQKIVIGKWLARDPLLFLLDEPTRGIDVGAKGEIYALMRDLAQQGKAVLFASSDLEEILAIADRIIVMHEGKITGQLAQHECDQTSIMQLATGQSPAHSISS